MREEAFAKFARPLESQFVYERRRSRGLLATVGAIAVAVGATVILALVVFNVSPRSKSEPSELAVSISTPALATPAASGDVRKIPRHCFEGFKQFQRAQGSESLEPAVSEPALRCERPRKRPKNPRSCLKSSCSGSHGNSVKNRTLGASLPKAAALPRVRLRGYSSAPTFCAHSRRSGSFLCRHALRVLARDAPSFACSSFSRTARQSDRRCLDARSCRDRREKQWSGQVAGHLKLPCDRSRLVASRQAPREGRWQPRMRGRNVCRLPRTDRCRLLP